MKLLYQYTNYKINKIMEKERKIEELLQIPRMFYVDINYDAYNFKVNSLKGLKMLIEEYVNDQSTVVEIGSFSGISSELFALHCKKLYCVDLWDPYWEITDKQIVEFAEWSFDKMASKYDHVTKIKGSSVDAANQFDDASIDFVYIDAAHDYENVKKDILAWIPKVKPGGFISGHDYRYDPGIQVYEAVNEIFAQTHKITTFPDSSFVVRL
jgi:predicted O-methyltransferase YrrM